MVNGSVPDNNCRAFYKGEYKVQLAILQPLRYGSGHPRHHNTPTRTDHLPAQAGTIDRPGPTYNRQTGPDNS